MQIDAAVGADIYRAMPQRTHLMMYMDANSQFGIVDDKQVESDSIGTHGLGNENGMGTQIREFFEAWHMFLPFTFKQLDPTFYSAGEVGRNTKIDQIAIPQAWKNIECRPFVWQKKL